MDCLSDLQLAAEIDGLGALRRPELCERWRALYGIPAPKSIGRDLLIRAIAYKMQESAYGGLSFAARRRLRQIAQDLQGKAAPAASASDPRLKPGTRLVRVWREEVHEVSVLDDGFLWRGERYGSLSAIAKAITGTHWNGWVFFGLRQSGAAPSRTPAGAAFSPAVPNRSPQANARVLGLGDA